MTRVWHEASQRRALGLDGFKKRVRSLRTSLSGYRATIEDLLADGDQVVARYNGRGTHNGPFLGVAPTGRPVTYSGIIIWRLADGKIAEEWTSWDALGVLQQLGAVSLALSLSGPPLACDSKSDFAWEQ
jgi:predicted ester cyclase